jgi:hypothetical protein
MTPKVKTASLSRLDRELISSFKDRYARVASSRGWRNKELYKRRSEIDSLAQFQRLERELESKGLFDVRCEKRTWRDLDGERRVFTLARAATTDMWPMGTHYWVRDNALIGARFLLSENHNHRRLGKELLLSALTFMSSVSQLKRMEAVVLSKSAGFLKDAANWPYIFAGVKTNLAAHEKEEWAHKQDAWQILAWYVLEGIERGLITRHDLTAKHRNFLSLIVPFLIKVSFWRCENSGSWEELVAARSSVRAWEHRLIARLGEFSQNRGFAFIDDGFTRYRNSLAGTYKKRSLLEAIKVAERSVAKEMLQDLPYESPSYKRSDPRRRQADAALIYLLQIDYPRFLAARVGRSAQWAEALEGLIFKTVSKLDDKVTGGIARYGNDSYQRQGFFRYLTVAKLQKLYGAPSGDASSHFVGRDKVVPRGRKAAWTHFVWQLAAWAGRRYLRTGDLKDKAMHDRFFRRGMSLITGDRETSIDWDASGKARILSIHPYRMPECYISDKLPGGDVAIFPSPHTPLNWAVGEMFDAFQIRRQVLASPT